MAKENLLDYALKKTPKNSLAGQMAKAGVQAIEKKPQTNADILEQYAEDQNVTNRDDVSIGDYIYKKLGQGTLQIGGALSGFGSGTARSLGAEETAVSLEELARELNAASEGLGKESGGNISAISGEDSLLAKGKRGDLGLGDVGSYLSDLALTQAPQLAVGAIAGIAGGALTPALASVPAISAVKGAPAILSRLLGSTAAMSAQETGSIYNDQEEKSFGQALAYGVPAGALEAAGQMLLLKNAGLGGLVSGALEKPTGSALKNILTSVAEESGTEFSQSVLEQMGANKSGNPFKSIQDVNWEQAFEEGIAGGVMGGAPSTAHAISKAVFARQKARISSGDDEVSLTDSAPTLDEKKAVVDGERVVAAHEQAVVQQEQEAAIVQAIEEQRPKYHPHVEAIAAETQANPAEVHSTIASLYERASGSFKTFAQSIKDLFGKGREFALKLWNSFKSFATSKLAEERGSFSTEDIEKLKLKAKEQKLPPAEELKARESSLLEQIQKAKDNNQPAENLEQELANTRAMLSVSKEKAGVKGINISTRSDDELGRALTNPTWGSKKDGKDYFDVETEYKKNASRKKAPELNAEEALRYDMNLMYKLQMEKFKKNPELVEEITKRGGEDFLEASEHTIGAKGSRWEGKGSKSNFIKVLKQSYKDSLKPKKTLQEEITEELPSVSNKSAEKWIPKEQAKTKLATQFIGEGSKGSSTENYRSLYEKRNLSNTGSYTSDDIVFVATNGKRPGGIAPVVDGKLQGQYQNVDKAIEAGAAIVADTRDHLVKTQKYNTGEVAIAKYLKDNGYERDDSSGAGIWRPKTKQESVPLPEESTVEEDSDYMSPEELAALIGKAKDPAAIDTVRMLAIDRTLEQNKVQKKLLTLQIKALQEKTGLNDEDFKKVVDEASKPTGHGDSGFAPLEVQNKSQKQQKFLVRKAVVGPRKPGAPIEPAKSRANTQGQHKFKADTGLGLKASSNEFSSSVKTYNGVKAVVASFFKEGNDAVKAGRAKHFRKMPGVYFYQNEKDTKHVASTIQGAIKINQAKVSKLFGYFKDGSPKAIGKAIDLLGENTPEALASMGLRVADFGSVFKTEKELTEFLVNHEKAHIYFKDDTSTVENEKRATLAALSPALRTRLENLWSEKQFASRWNLGTDATVTEPKSKQSREEREASDKAGISPTLDEKSASAIIKQNSEESLAAMYGEDENPVEKDFEENEEDVVLDEDEKAALRRGPKRGAVNEGQEEVTQQAILGNNLRALMADKGSIFARIRMKSDVIKSGVRVLNEEEIEENIAKARQQIEDELSELDAFISEAPAKPWDKFALPAQERISAKDILLEEFDALDKAGLYLPDVLAKVKAEEGITSLAKAKNGSLDSLFELVTAVEEFSNLSEDQETPESYQQRIKEISQRAGKEYQAVLRNERLLGREDAGKEGSQMNREINRGNMRLAYEKTPAEIKQGQRETKEREVAREELLNKQAAALEKSLPDYDLASKVLETFLKVVQVMAASSKYNEIVWTNPTKVAKTIASSVDPKTEAGKAFRNLSEEKQVAITRLLYSVVNRAGNKPFSTFKFDQDIDHTYLAEQIENATSLDQLGQALDPIVIDEITHGVSSHMLVNTLGQQVQHVWYIQHGKNEETGEVEWPVFKIGQTYQDLKRLEALEAKYKKEKAALEAWEEKRKKNPNDKTLGDRPADPSGVSGIRTFNAAFTGRTDTVTVKVKKRKGANEVYWATEEWPIESYYKTRQRDLDEVNPGKKSASDLPRIIAVNKVTLERLKTEGYQEIVHNWESSKDQEAFIQQVIDQAESHGIITDAAVGFYNEAINALRSKDLSVILGFLETISKKRVYATNEKGERIEVDRRLKTAELEKQYGELKDFSSVAEKGTQAGEFQKIIKDVVEDTASAFYKAVSKIIDTGQEAFDTALEKLKKKTSGVDLSVKTKRLERQREAWVEKTIAKEAEKIVEKINDVVSRELKADFIKESMKRSLLFSPKQLDTLVQRYEKFGVTKTDILKAYIQGGGNLKSLAGYLNTRIESHQSKTFDKILRANRDKVLSEKEAFDVLTAGLTTEQANRFKLHLADNGAKTIEDKILFDRMAALFSRLTYKKETIPTPQQQRIKNAIAKTSSLASFPSTIAEWATAKSQAGLPIGAADIVQQKAKLTAYEQDLQSRMQAKDQTFSIVQLRSKAARVFYGKIAKIFGAELVVISSDTYKTRYAVINGKPKLLINIKQGTDFHKMFGHELFHHVANKATPAEYKAFTNALREYGKKSRTFYSTEMAKEALENDEVQAEVFSEVFTDTVFFEILKNTFGARSLAQKILLRLTDMASKVISLYSDIRKERNLFYEEKAFIAQSDLREVYGLIANLLADAYQNQSLQNNETKYLGGAYTAEVMGWLGNSKNWLNGIYRSLVPKGSKNFKDIMGAIERMNVGFVHWIKDHMPESFIADFKASMASKALADKALNYKALEKESLYRGVLKKHEKVFKGKSQRQLENLNDFFARGLYIKDRKDLERKLKENNRDFNTGKIDKAKYDYTLEKLYREHTVKVKEDGSAINLRLEEDIELARSYGISDDIINAFKDYKAVSDKLYTEAKRYYPDLEYRPDHFAQSIRWYRSDGALLDDSIEAPIKPARWEQFRNESLPVEALKILRGINYRTINPNEIAKQYVHDLYRALGQKAIIDEGTQQGLIRILPPTGVHKQYGMEEINDPVYDIKADSDNLHRVGWKVVEKTESYQVNHGTFYSEGAAQEKLQSLPPRTNGAVLSIEEVEWQAKGGIVARAYFKKDLAKMMRTVVAKDKFRQGSLFGISGNSVLKVKNVVNAVEFAFSLFHAMTIIQEVTAGFASFYQQTGKGISKLQGFNVIKSGKDIQKIAALTHSYLEDPEITKQPAFQKEAVSLLGVEGADVVDAIAAWFGSGGRLDMDEAHKSFIQDTHEIKYTSKSANYKMVNGELVYEPMEASFKAVADSIKDIFESELAKEPDKKIRALMKTVGYATTQGSTEWLMRKFIPRAKLAMFLREYSLKVKINEKKIASGAISKAHIASQTLKFVEDRMGEVNWDQQFIAPTYRSILQTLFRSFTWFTGSWKALAKAGLDIGKLGWFTAKGEGAFSGKEDRYKITEQGLWGINAVITHIMTAGLVTASYALVAGVSGDEVPDDEEISLMTKLLFPRYDRHDPSARVSVPSYVTELYKIMHHLGLSGTQFEPFKLISGRFNSIFGNAYEVFEGTDFRGVTVRDSRDPVPVQAFDAITHIFNILPISVSSAKGVMQQKGFDGKSLLLSALGMTQAPAVAKRSAAANLAFQIRREEFKGGKITSDDMELKDEISRAAYAYGDGDKKPLNDMLKEGRISPIKYRNAIKKIPRISGKKNPLYRESVVQAFKGLTVDGAIETWGYASDREKKLLKPIFIQKYINAVSRRTLSGQKLKETQATLKEIGVL